MKTIIYKKPDLKFHNQLLKPNNMNTKVILLILVSVLLVQCKTKTAKKTKTVKKSKTMKKKKAVEKKKKET